MILCEDGSACDRLRMSALLEDVSQRSSFKRRGCGIGIVHHPGTCGAPGWLDDGTIS